MGHRTVIAALMLVCAASGQAFAFSEVPIAPGAPSAGMSATNPPVVSTPEGGAGVALAPGSTEGTEVVIPGVGSVGALPSLDFGLELLYGNNADGKIVDPAPTKDDDLLVRGTVKHRF